MPKRNPGARLEWRDDRKVWEIISYERGARKRKSTGTDDRNLAQQQLVEFLSAAAKPESAGPLTPDQRMIADALAGYMQERAAGTASSQTVGFNVRALLPYWGSLRVRDVKATTCQAYVDHRVTGEKPVKPATAARELAVLGAALRWDWKAGRITDLIPVTLPPKSEPKDRWLTRDEAARLLWECRHDWHAMRHLRLFILIGLYTGARKEAILSLRWPQVDLQRRLIDFNPPGRQRTSKGRPVIPIPGKLMTILRGARRRGTDIGHVVTYHGQPVDDVKKAFAAACRRAGLEGVSPHTLRHTCASWLAQAGVSFPKIAKYLGHSNSRTTEQVYAKHAPDYLSDVTTALDGKRRR